MVKFIGSAVPEYPAALAPTIANHIVDKDYVDVQDALWLPKAAFANLAASASITVSTSATSGNNVNSTSNVFVAGPASSPGPALTATTGTSVLVTVGCTLSQNTSSSWAGMSFAVSGATTRASAGFDEAVAFKAGTIPASNSEGPTCCNTILVTGLTAGSNTFTAMYGFLTGGQAGFSRRTLVVQRMN